MKKIKVKLKTPIAFFKYQEHGNSFEIKNDEEVEVYPTMGVLKLLFDKKLIQINE